MNTAYSELLDATIRHLERLKQEGCRHVEVSQETLDLLSTKPKRPITSTPTTARSTAQVAPASAPRFTSVIAPQASPVTAVAGTRTETVENKTIGMEELAARAAICVKCPHLASSRRNVVFGVGDIHAPLMFIGEAPGMDEDEQGEPFVGKAGQLLTKIIETMGFERANVYIANILKCRPDTPGQTSGNRKPNPQEMQNCLPYLNAQIDLIKPRVIVALGGSAVEGLLGNAPLRITQLRGQFADFRGIPMMQTYHPSYLLRPNPVNVKRQVWEDMMKVMEKLGLPISEKQRGFFLAKN